MSCDVLNLEWSSAGRDRVAASLVAHELRAMGREVVEDSIFNYRLSLLKYKPKVLFITNVAGGNVNVRAVKRAVEMNIPVVSLVSEGNFGENRSPESLWGHNKEMKLHENINCHWSAVMRDRFLDACPDCGTKLRVSGAVGFDYYKIFSFPDRCTFLKEYEKKDCILVGLAGYGFDQFYGEYYEKYVRKVCEKDYCDRARKDGVLLSKIYVDLISNNPEVTFLLKEHPGNFDETKSELYAARDLPNVIYVRNEKTIAECISACDLWLAYDSTTAMEAWLLQKQTAFVNPSGPDFPRSRIWKGVPVFEDYQELQKAVSSFLDCGELPGFAEKRNNRECIIRDIIQWDDGKNHMRAASYIDELLQSSDVVPWHAGGISNWIIAHAHNLIFQGAALFPRLRPFKKYGRARKIFRKSELSAWMENHKHELAEFSRNHPLTDADKAELKDVNQKAAL